MAGYRVLRWKVSSGDPPRAAEKNSVQTENLLCVSLTLLEHDGAEHSIRSLWAPSARPQCAPSYRLHVFAQRCVLLSPKILHFGMRSNWFSLVLIANEVPALIPEFQKSLSESLSAC